MVVIRWILGRLILLLNFIFPPRGLKRSAEQQATIDAETAQLTLYQYLACPFCVKVRRSMKRHTLNIETRDAKRNKKFREELVEGGGKLKVPCLRIEEESGSVRWMYESSNIITYLEQGFALAKR
jgi:glutaredoxin